MLDLIGEGSFGRVFRGQERDTGRVVALKLIPKVGHSERELKSLRSECKIQRELDHPNIVRMLDAFETDNEVISVAEYVPGELFRLFDQYRHEVGGARRLPEARVQELAADLVCALHYLHSHRVLHRDIKPQNILLDAEGRAKLCDFGFARNLGMNTFVLTSIKGTPLYMAPELIEEKPYDHTADLWSLGCILYELLVGQPPFSTTSLFQLIKKIRYECIQWPGHLSPEARSLLAGLLEKDSRRRLSWPDLPHHPWLREVVRPELLLPGPDTLTRGLTASQELAKEMQRQDKARLLPGGSQTLIRVAQKHELARTQLAAMGRGPVRKQEPQRRFSDVGQGGGRMLLGRHDPRLQARRVSCLPSIAQAQYLAPPPPKEPLQFVASPPGQGVARPAALRPGPGGETEVARVGEERNTSMDSNETLKDTSETKDEEESDTSKGEGFEVEDKPLENAEWCEFLDCQLEEMLREVEQGDGCPDSMDNQNLLAMLVTPLHNRHTDSLLLHKLCLLLCLPLATQKPTSPTVAALLQAFHTKRLVHSLVVALVVQTERSVEETDDSTGLAALTCLLLRLATTSPPLKAQLQDAVQGPGRQAALLALLEARRPAQVQGDGLALLSHLLHLQGLSPTTVALLPGLLEPLLLHHEEKVARRALTLVGMLVRAQPGELGGRGAKLVTACREEGRGWGEHTRGAARWAREGLELQGWT